MTEEEALKRWCPFASSRVVSVDFPDNVTETGVFSTGFSPLGNKVPTTLCIGSKCMAWKLRKKWWNQTKGNYMEQGSQQEPTDIFYLRESEEGYCGLTEK